MILEDLKTVLSLKLVRLKLHIAIEKGATDKADQPYIAFTEPNGKVYDIHFTEDGSQYSVRMVERNIDIDENSYFIIQPTVQLESFVGPDKKTYRIDRKNETGVEIPSLGKIYFPNTFPNISKIKNTDSSPTTSSDCRVTFIVAHNYYVKHVHFIFSNDGELFFDRGNVSGMSFLI